MRKSELRQRYMTLEHTDAESDEFTLSFSSELPVERPHGIEILSHDVDAVDLSRLNDRAPLLMNHNADKLVGAVMSAEIVGGKGRAVCRWGTSDLAQQARADVAHGVLKNVSVGYEIIQEDTDDLGRIVVTRWMPLEISLVSVPSDPTVGVGRSHKRSIRKTKSQPIMNNFHPVTPIAKGFDEYSRESQEFSMVRAIQASASGDWSQAGREREINQELQRREGKRTQGFLVPEQAWSKRAFTAGSATGGGNLIQTELLAASFIDALRDRLAIAELGAQMLPGLVGNVNIPKRTGSSTAYWFGADNADAVTESTGTIGHVSMQPRTVGAYSKFSRLMQLQSTPEIEQLIRADFVALLADAIDSAAINGTGADSEPQGILNTSGIGSVAGGTNGLAPTLDHLLDLKKEVAVDNADLATCGFLTNAKVEGVISKLKDSNNAYHLSPYGSELGQSQIAGRRFVVSNNVPSNLTKGSGTGLSAIIYGNFSDLLIGMYGTLEILTDPYTDFAKGTVGVRALQSIDIAVRHAESFAAMSDAIAS